MEVDDVSPALQQRLGAEGTAGLLASLETAREEWADDVTATAVDRIDRRIADESATYRVSLGAVEATLGTEIGNLGAALRVEMAERTAALRTDMAELRASMRVEVGGLATRAELHEEVTSVRAEIAQLGTDLRREMSELRFSVVKWNFVFWTGQLLATAALMSVFLQAVR
jgi:hypothetical protein